MTDREEDYGLAHPDVQAVKAKWNEERRKSNRVSADLAFEDLFECFKSNKESMASVARRNNVSRQHLGNIYNAYFRKFFGEASGRGRQKERVRSRRNSDIAASAERLFQSDPVLSFIVKSAQGAGHKVKEVLQLPPDESIRKAREHLIIRKRVLIIDGRRCLVCSSEKGHQNPGYDRTYMRLTLSSQQLSESDAVIFFINIPKFKKRLFIVPCADIEKALFGKKPTPARKTVNIPTENLPPYCNMRPKITWWDYENTWAALHTIPVSA